MKTLFLILLICLFSCSTPEKKIIKSFNDDRHSLSRSISAKEAKIYDTIYIKQVESMIPTVSAEIELLEKRIKNMSFFRDSVYRLNRIKPTRDSMMRFGFNKIKSLNMERDHNRMAERFYYDLYTSQTKDSICGYYTRIITNKQDTLNFIIRANFSILCPTFMIEK